MSAPVGTLQSETVNGKDVVQISQLMAERVSAMCTGDADRLVSHYAPGAVTFDLDPPLLHAGAEVHDAERRRAWFATFDGPVNYDIRDLSITVGGDVAFCHSLNGMGATPLGVPGGFELWFRATVCLRRIDGAWRITHEHNSTPFYMDGSFRAAVDLKP